MSYVTLSSPQRDCLDRFPFFRVCSLQTSDFARHERRAWSRLPGCEQSPTTNPYTDAFVDSLFATTPPEPRPRAADVLQAWAKYKITSTGRRGTGELTRICWLTWPLNPSTVP